ncbi:MAG: 2Fe-2S iron-sulfur cluster binding domain-containing protein [Halieaceae bacterium]|jgi:2Fe-2S ferredoxin|nr:2Fe-2S iron-sulfur cluster binding domain-containing protein [Halieaceae bacterium]
MSDLPKITVISRDGVTSTLEQSAGQATLMQLLFENDQGVEAACGGCASCATCHVYIAEEWVSRLPPREQVEDLLLAYSDHFDSGRSRLSCQISMTSELNGLVLEIAPEE